MENIVLGAHGAWRWVALIVLVAAFLEGVVGLVGRGEWLPRSATAARMAAAAYDVQVFLGLLLYLSSRQWAEADPFHKFIHPALMLIGLLVIHQTALRARRGATSRGRHLWLAAGTAVTLLIAVGAGALGR
ncbi:MAG: hypothetical protein ACE5EL_02295 [Anaerolineae bacterium]